MQKDKRKLLVNIGAVLAAALCFIGVFGIIHHSGRHTVQASPDRTNPVKGPVQDNFISMEGGAGRKMLTEALRKKPDHIPILLQLSHLEAESGNVRKASEYLTEVLQYEPRNLEAKLNLGKQMFETGNVEDAIRLNQEILEIEPMHPDALYNLGAIYGNLGNRERALFFWNQLVNSTPNSESGMRAREMMAHM
jgi:tetratricopeptide (TPR) repeat protein